jgi:uncharacterized protein (TIGR02996 family)
MPTATWNPTLRFLAGRSARSPQEVAFLCALLEQPEDRAAGLAYADWLEERGDSRAEYARSRLKAPRRGRAKRAAEPEGPWQRLFTLRERLRDVSRNCLRGQPVPDALTALWEAELAGESLIAGPELDETSLLTDPRPYVRRWPRSTPAAQYAYRALFREVAVVAVACSPALVGYWLQDDSVDVANAPVVALDAEGPMACTAPTLQDHFLFLAEIHQGPEWAARVRSWFEQRGVSFPFSDRRAHAAAWDLPDLEDRFNALVEEFRERE